MEKVSTWNKEKVIEWINKNYPHTKSTFEKFTVLNGELLLRLDEQILISLGMHKNDAKNIVNDIKETESTLIY